ncbi:hypothetical protein ACVWY2_002446 [Bradyrhizobium sp. JR6.1]
MVALQVADQREDLLLGGDVERGGRLVRDQELRFQHQRHRDHDALALSARQAVRVGREDALHIGQPHMLHHRQDLLTPRAGVEIGMGAQHLVDLAADRHDRIERGHRLLEDHRHPRRAQLAQPPVGRGKQFLADQFDAAAGRHQRALLQQAHRGQRGHRLARAAFADKAERLALAHLQRQVVDDAVRVSLAAETDDEIVDVEDDVGHVRVSCCEGARWGRHRHSGMVRKHQTPIRNCELWNLEIPQCASAHWGSVLRTAPG